MQALFRQLMTHATRLTAQGDLRAATSAIQRALNAGTVGEAVRPHATVSTQDTMVIDVEALEVPVTADAGHEVAVDHIPARTRQEEGRHRPSSADGRVVRGRYSCAEGQRDWRLYVPPGAAGRALPLVVMLHGCTQDPDDFAAGTAMDDAAREQGFLVLYPAQCRKSNPQACWNWFKHSHQQRGKGEPALLAGLTREIIAEHGADPRRVYVAGLSAGGAMAAILGQTYPDLYAAVGVHSGLAAGAANDLPSALAAMAGGAADLRMPDGLNGLPGMPGASKKASPLKCPGVEGGSGVPTIVFHGDQDRTVHPVNGNHVVSACMRSQSADGASSVSEEKGRQQGRAYTRHIHVNGEGRPLAEHWLVHGAGHAWAGGRPHGSYTDAGGPDATREMLRFFLSHTLRSKAFTS